ncbi:MULTISPECIES: O-methyltransferase [Bacillaceae]|uniref:Methyltransferase n=1 Tax=Gottfriedia luciferensis TaxID=178774 RepID=A0ABX2ZN24_9BACI|nr:MULTISPECIES: O-methyltransferase [Bacillaceae]ODG91110.1 methyltransferase [Gottfriedia luciferensis]SFC79825.1 Predicted O-methyltransferase YrrM [Bacillus sp. UNCCL81]
MPNNVIWNDVDEYFVEKLIPNDPILENVLLANYQAGLPSIDVSPTQGKLLYLLAKIKGAKNILEIGTLGGYSSIWLARALPEDGKLTTLEISHEHAKVAKQNIIEAKLQEKVEIIIGKALDTLPTLKESKPLFDFIFIDADKPNNPHYLKWALKLASSGALIIVDNVVRNGEVIYETSQDESVKGVRELLDLITTDSRIDTTAIQTVGLKGYDGFVIGVVK